MPSELTYRDARHSDELLSLDPDCPRCGVHCGVGEIFDGADHHCENCGAHLVAVAYTDGTMAMQRAMRHRNAWQGSHRERTRRRWNRQGRRG